MPDKAGLAQRVFSLGLGDDDGRRGGMKRAIISILAILYILPEFFFLAAMLIFASLPFLWNEALRAWEEDKGLASPSGPPSYPAESRNERGGSF